MKKKIIALTIIGMFLLISSSAIIVAADKNQTIDNEEITVSEGPDEFFKVEVLSAFYRQARIPFEIKINTNEKITGVTLEFLLKGNSINYASEPNIIFSSVINYMEYYTWIGDCIGDIWGLGRFTVTARLTCNEGLIAEDTATGLLIGSSILFLKS